MRFPDFFKLQKKAPEGALLIKNYQLIICTCQIPMHQDKF